MRKLTMYACMMGLATLTLCTLVTVRGGRPDGYVLLPVVWVEVIGLVVIAMWSANAKTVVVVLLALVAVATAYCGGAGSLGGLHARRATVAVR